MIDSRILKEMNKMTKPQLNFLSYLMTVITPDVWDDMTPEQFMHVIAVLKLHCESVFSEYIEELVKRGSEVNV